ncbi:MAG: hypothetical protein A2Y79_14490 [Deltaproteobacteria bacterium RBG_13_43_22]|nr:MAG: hypothetical protein A2Y79_14490 [Deltaproteobacteria bacterium RBG_13_43_22]
MKRICFGTQPAGHENRPVRMMPPLRQDGGKPGRIQQRSVRIVSMVCFLFMVSGFLTTPAGFPAGKGKMNNRINWPPGAIHWKWDRKEITFKGKSLYRYIDGAAEVYLAYNFRQVNIRRYVKTNHPDIIAEVYRMGSSEDAFGVFSLEQQDPDAGIGQGSEFGGNLLRFWKGRYFVTVLGNGAGKELEEAVLNLGRELARGIKETGRPPRLLGYLPDQDRLTPADRVCFVRSHILLNRCFFISHQNILGLGKEVEAVIARYPLGKNKLRILLIRYPTTPRAYSAFSNFKTSYLPEAEISGSVRTEDGLWTRVEIHQKLVIIVFGGRQETEAEQLVQDILKKVKGESS